MSEPTEGAFPVEPLDEHNRKLLDNVHPASWQNPRPKERYHLVVVGAGTAGLVSAAGAAGLGAKVALVERHLMGGDCLNVGCVPSKGVIRAARAWQEARDAHRRFGGPLVDAAQSFAAAMERMRRLRAQIAPHDSAARFRDLGIDVFLGQGRFVAPDAVEVGGARLRFRRAVIATGARASAPGIPGLAELGYRTNETFFNLTELPRRLAVIGGGPIGCEMAQAFARFGSEVTLLDRGGHVLGREDADAAEIVQQTMARDGVRFVFGAKILEARRGGTVNGASGAGGATGGASGPAIARGGVAGTGGTSGAGGARVLVYEQGGERQEIAADEVLAAAGRTPNTDGLGLEAAGVRYGPRGVEVCLLYTSPSPRDGLLSRMPSSA